MPSTATHLTLVPAAFLQYLPARQSQPRGRNRDLRAGACAFAGARPRLPGAGPCGCVTRIPRVSSLAWIVNLPSVNSVADGGFNQQSAAESPGKSAQVIDVGQVSFQQRVGAGGLQRVAKTFQSEAKLVAVGIKRREETEVSSRVVRYCTCAELSRAKCAASRRTAAPASRR